MTECHRCNTEKQSVKTSRGTVELCLHTGCLMNRMLEKYERCSHDLETVRDHLLKCGDCGMNATPSYQ